MKQFLSSFGFASELFYTSISFFIFAAIYASIFFFIKKQEWSIDKKHRHYVSIRNLVFFIFSISLIFIWSGEIKTFIVSAAAIMGAMIIVFKEILLAVVGSILTNKVFNIGDYIEYEGFKGRIVDKTFLNTRVLISGPFQSRELIFPNMHYVTNKIVNLSKFGKFQTYSLCIGIEKIELLKDCSEQALLFAKQASASHKDKFEKYFHEQKRGQMFFEVPNIEPKVTYELGESRKCSFTIHYISHPLDKDTIEDEILKEYLNYVQKFKSDSCKEKEEKDEN